MNYTFLLSVLAEKMYPLVVPLGDGYEKTSTMAHPFGNYSPGIFPIKQHGPGPQEVMFEV